ncbi:MAG: TlpA family protein disulfide reductase [Chloroflexi bacterium]|nr:TlpA family protein disulfide reductase [Chloroflexota bacterium]
MATSRKKYRRKQRKSFPFIPVSVGVLLIGFALFTLASPQSDAHTETRNSVVPVAVHYAAPELSLQNLTGETESLADYRGQVVLVNNWATWCPPCKAEMPTLAAYYSEHHADGFTLIAIEAGDPPEAVAQFAKDYGLKFPVWLDPNSDSLKAFGNGSLPNSYVIDRSGAVRYAWTGEIGRSMLEQYVTPLIEESN